MAASLAILKCNLDIMSIAIIKKRILVFSSPAGLNVDGAK
jgi:hypothetical protein